MFSNKTQMYEMKPKTQTSRDVSHNGIFNEIYKGTSKQTKTKNVRRHCTNYSIKQVIITCNNSMPQIYKGKGYLKFKREISQKTKSCLCVYIYKSILF